MRGLQDRFFGLSLQKNESVLINVATNLMFLRSFHRETETASTFSRWEMRQHSRHGHYRMNGSEGPEQAGLHR